MSNLTFHIEVLETGLKVAWEVDPEPADELSDLLGIPTSYLEQVHQLHGEQEILAPRALECHPSLIKKTTVGSSRVLQIPWKVSTKMYF